MLLFVVSSFFVLHCICTLIIRNLLLRYPVSEIKKPVDVDPCLYCFVKTILYEFRKLAKMEFQGKI